MKEAKETHGAPAYETTDAKTKPLYGAGLLLAVVIIASFLIGSWMLGMFESSHEAQRVDNPLEQYQARPQDAVLQAQPKLAMEAYRAEMEAVATSYGWIDRPNGIVRIPIERAVERLLEEGLPEPVEGADEDVSDQ